jgi:hypothetical protein
MSWKAIKSRTINPLRDPGRQIGSIAHERLRLESFLHVLGMLLNYYITSSGRGLKKSAILVLVNVMLDKSTSQVLYLNQIFNKISVRLIYPAKLQRLENYLYRMILPVCRLLLLKICANGMN